jgi:hypothetical protein
MDNIDALEDGLQQQTVLLDSVVRDTLLDDVEGVIRGQYAASPRGLAHTPTDRPIFLNRLENHRVT